MKARRGFTLVEGIIALAILGVVLAALFFFIRGTGQATREIARRSDSADLTMAAASLENLLSNAGYMGDVFPGAWQPVILAEEDRFTFVANIEDRRTFGPEDTLTIANIDGRILVRNSLGSLHMPPIQGEVTFRYFDSQASEVFSPDQVRRIEYSLRSPDGTVITATVSPLNLAMAHDEEMLRGFFESLQREDDLLAEQIIFFESFEESAQFAFFDEMEAATVWVPFITEDFEDFTIFNNNWERWTEHGYAGRGTGPAYQGSYFLYLCCSPSNPVPSTQYAIWKVDLSDYTWADPLRLNFWWTRGLNVPYPAETGLFLPVWVEGSTTTILSENFEGFRDGFPKNWTYWNDGYGQVRVMSLYSPPSGAYLNQDTRRLNYTGESRVMVTQDLSAYAASSDLVLTFDLCRRGSQNEYFRVMIMGPDGITGNPVATHNVNLSGYASGSWATVSIDLDALIPPEYNMAETRIVFAQRGNGVTSGASWYGGVSIDNVTIAEQVDSYWDMSRKITVADPAYQTWQERNVDLTWWAQHYGIPFSSEFHIGFQHRGNNPGWAEGLLVDLVSIQKQEWGMQGWTHGPWPGFTLSEWIPSEHLSFVGDW